MRKPISILFALVLLAPAAPAQDRTGERQAVKGLLGAVVIISVDQREPRLASHARKAELEAFTESELRRIGLQTGEKKHLLRDPPTLVVLVNAQRCREVLIARVELGLLDRVTTWRDPETPFTTTIWQEGYTVFLVERDGDEKIRRAISRGIDMLSGDLQAANPPQREKGRDQ
jgi:hypothetical protein